jgi:hypothetical protein
MPLIQRGKAIGSQLSRESSAPSPPLDHMIDLGEHQRRGDQLLPLGHDPVAHRLVIGLVGDREGDDDRGVEHNRHSPNPVASR